MNSITPLDFGTNFTNASTVTALNSLTNVNAYFNSMDNINRFIVQVQTRSAALKMNNLSTPTPVAGNWKMSEDVTSLANIGSTFTFTVGSTPNFGIRCDQGTSNNKAFIISNNCAALKASTVTNFETASNATVYHVNDLWDITSIMSNITVNQTSYQVCFNTSTQNEFTGF